MAKHVSGGFTTDRETTHYGTVVEARITLDSTTRKSAIKTFRVGTLKQRRKAAGDWLTDTAREVADGTYVSEKDKATADMAAAQAKANVHTLRTWSEHTLKVNTKRSEATREQYRAAIHRHLVPFLDVPLTDITTDAIEAHYAELVAAGSGPVSIARSNAALSGILTDAVRKRIITINPARLVDLPQAPEPMPKKALTIEQVLTLLAHADTLGPMMAAAFRVAITAGLRRSELVALRWDAVNLTEATVKINRTATLDAKGHVRNTLGTKTKWQGRTVAIPKATAHALTHLLTQEKAKATRLGLLPWNDDRPVFTDDAAQQIRPDWFSDQVRAATTAAQVPPLTAHSLRHSNGTILAEDGVDVLTISRHLGHSSTRVTESVYIHELAARERTAADALDKLIS